MFSVFLIFVFFLGLNKELISHEGTKVMFSFQGKLTVKKSHNNCALSFQIMQTKEKTVFILLLNMYKFMNI